MFRVISKSIVPHDYSSTSVEPGKILSKNIMSWSKQNISKEMLYVDPDDPNKGRETEIHVTVKYGIHTDSVEEVRDVCKNFGSFSVKLGKVTKFESEDYDVIKIDVTSRRLHQLNNLIKTELKCTDTFPKYVPHLTLAYVKKGKGDELLGNKDFDGEEFIVDHIVFSNKKGDKTKISLIG